MKSIRFKNIVLATLFALLLLPNLGLAASNIDFGKVEVSGAESALGEAQKFIYLVDEGEVVNDVLKVKNSSTEELKFEVMAADSKIENDSNFILNSKNEENFGVGRWITFEEKNFVLKAGQTKEIPFKIQIPTNADVGVHKGGILVERFVNTEDGLGLNLQQGTPVSIEVRGQLVTGAKFASQQTQEIGDFYDAYYSIQNEGNHSISSSVRFVVKNDFSTSEKVYEQNASLPRGGSNYLRFNWEKPLFGFYTVKAELIDNDTGKVLDVSKEQNYIFLSYLELAVFAFLLLLLIFRKKILAKISRLSHKKNVNRVIAVLLVATTLSYVQYRFPIIGNDIKSSIIISDVENANESGIDYYMVMRWGHLREGVVDPDNIRMSAKLNMIDATMTVLDKYSFDEDDDYKVKNADRTVEINSKVKDDFDGLLVGISTSLNSSFTLAFEDKVRNLVSVYSINELSKGVTVEAKRGTPYTFGKAEIKLFKNLSEVDSYLESQKVKAPSGSQDVLLNFDSATPDFDNKKVLNKEETLAVLNSILSEKSATPDVDTSLKLNSDFVESVVKSDVGSEILASKQFIAELLASPIVLAALAATAQANVLFLPADTIVFPKQSFSFEDRKIASTVIGTLVFIHKKDNPWNAYVSSSDFEILSGGEKVPASNLSIVPGPIIPINNSEISSAEVQRGEKHRLQDQDDQAILVTTSAPKDVMFIMRPRLELILPASTRAGVYRGTLTITYIDRS